MIDRQGEQATVSAPMTMNTAGALMHAGIAAIDDGVRTFDLSGTGEVDSAALAVLFAWFRHASAKGVDLHLNSLPAQVNGLADVYDVSDVIAGHLATSA